ncbi:hypothetical protein BpHYR1_040504 [Brachionus plicatilis]|uniref:Uncharacterized protein n=1 Tax=Brachionus plicatilis TaxID=10195 RepID=A0A3M7RME2_BRAPC|nr:hypothetical protein BpHYR1_040504 [Brachionus plicatilis]
MISRGSPDHICDIDTSDGENDVEKIPKITTALNMELAFSLSRIFFFQNKYLINFFSCVYLSSHTVSRYPLISSSGLGTDNGMIATQQSAAKVTYGTIVEKSLNFFDSHKAELKKLIK